MRKNKEKKAQLTGEQETRTNPLSESTEITMSDLGGALPPNKLPQKSKQVHPPNRKQDEREKEKEEKEEVAGALEAGGIYPRFLKTQSHIHAEWILGGFAELIHNSYDARASHLDIFVDLPSSSSSSASSSPIIHLVDNGDGMERKDLVRMLCFGHEDEGETNRIGKFGVGFKTGSMRIADDTMVFTRTQTTQSIEKPWSIHLNISGGKRYTVDKVRFDLSVHSKEQVTRALEFVYKCSPYKNSYMLQSQFEKVQSHGTHVVLFNIRTPELDFTSDPQDIRIASPGSGELFIKRRQGQQATDVDIDYSLRAYCSVMFLKPRMNIAIREVPIRARFFHKTLSNTEFHSRNGVHLLLGYNKRDKERGVGGFMMYWHGVLIQAYHRVGIMLHNSDAGNGVIGIVECDGLEPLNNKQAFNEAKSDFRATEKWLEERLSQYWYEKIQKDLTLDVDANTLKPQLDWVMCNKCNKWRSLPPGMNVEELPKIWFCRMNSNTKYNACDKPEEEATGHVTVNYSNQSSKTNPPPPTSTTIPPKSSGNSNNTTNTDNKSTSNKPNSTTTDKSKTNKPTTSNDKGGNTKTSTPDKGKTSTPDKGKTSTHDKGTTSKSSNSKGYTTTSNNNNNNNNKHPPSKPSGKSAANKPTTTNKNTTNHSSPTHNKHNSNSSSHSSSNSSSHSSSNSSKQSSKLNIVPTKPQASTPTTPINTATPPPPSSTTNSLSSTSSLSSSSTIPIATKDVTTAADKKKLLSLAAANLDQADKLVQQLNSRKLFSSSPPPSPSGDNQKKKKRSDMEEDIQPKKKMRNKTYIEFVDLDDDDFM